jgi:rod shape determining protein RodA
MRLLKTDPWLWGTTLFLIAVGLVTIASVSYPTFLRQLIWVAVAIAVIFSLQFMNLQAVLSYRWVVLLIYLGTLALLVFTCFAAPAIRGTRSWIVAGAIQIQPSEFMKAALIILFSSFFALRHVSIAHWGTIAVSFVYFLVPTVFVLIQPDMGTALVLFALWFGYLVASEIPWRHLFAFFMVFAIVGSLAWNFGLADYQKERVKALANPSYEPLGVNYNVIQAKIAIGSAGFFGKGFRQGTQVQLGFLPAAATDFAFSAFTEEWGIFGALLVIAAYFVLMSRILKIGLAARNNFHRFLCLGTAIFILVHLVVNLGSNLGLLPVIGVSMPLVSYGGSNLLTVALLLGIIQHIARRAAF